MVVGKKVRKMTIGTLAAPARRRVGCLAGVQPGREVCGTRSAAWQYGGTCTDASSSWTVDKTAVLGFWVATTMIN